MKIRGGVILGTLAALLALTPVACGDGAVEDADVEDLDPGVEDLGS